VVPATVAEEGRVEAAHRRNFFKREIRGMKKRVRECFSGRQPPRVEEASLDDRNDKSEPSTQSVKEVEEEEEQNLAEFGLASDFHQWKWSTPVEEVAIEELEEMANFTVAPLRLKRSASSTPPPSCALLTFHQDSPAPGGDEDFSVAPLGSIPSTSSTAAPRVEEGSTADAQCLVPAPLFCPRRATSSDASGSEECLSVAPLKLGKTSPNAPRSDEGCFVAPLQLGKKRSTCSVVPETEVLVTVAPLAIPETQKLPIRSALKKATGTNRVVSKSVRFEDDSRPAAWRDWQFHRVIPRLADEPPTYRADHADVNLLHPASGGVEDGRPIYDGMWLPHLQWPGYECRLAPPEVNSEFTRRTMKEQLDEIRQREARYQQSREFFAQREAEVSLKRSERGFSDLTL
jgi:hypothetical protein